jgi:membrane fusion protein (multidrug efflux system)
LAVIILPKTGLFSRESETISGTGNAPGSGLPVSACVVKPGLLELSISAAGTLMPSEEVEVTTEVSGLVKSIHFDEGSIVKKGELLLRINDDELQAQHEKAIHQKKLIEEKVERQRVLLEKEAVSQESFDQVRTDLLVIESEIRLLDTRIEKTYIRAPFDGTVGFRSVSPGGYLQPGVSVARLVKVSPLRIEFAIPERYQSEVLVGRDVNFTVAGYPNDFIAQVYAINPKVEERTRSIILRASYSNDDYKLLPGVFANIRLIISREENALQIPSEAIIPQMEGERVFVYRNGKAELVFISTGTRTEDRVAIKEGLVAGDTLLTSGILQLRSGMPVVINQLNE